MNWFEEIEDKRQHMFLIVDIENFYPMHELPHPVCMMVPFDIFPEDIVEQYDEANHHAVPTNKTRYNPILFQLKSIILLAIALGIFFIIQILQRCYTNYASVYLILFLPELMSSLCLVHYTGVLHYRLP